MEGDPGYGDLLCVAHECSALAASCLMTRRSDWGEVGGMDELHFPTSFHGTDYCLKLRALGKRIVFTPHAKLVHLGPPSLDLERRPEHRPRFERELRNLRTKWGRVLAADPYYSPMLASGGEPYGALSWPVPALRPRFNHPPVAGDIPPGS
jgi:GT2 family glycosyltransferase